MAKSDAASLEVLKADPMIGVVPLILVVTTAVILAVGAACGAMYWLVGTGKLQVQVTPQAAKLTPPAAPPARHEVVLEPLLVNLADAGGSAYLRVGITLSVFDTALPKGEKPKDEKADKGQAAIAPHEAALRDAALTVIGRSTTADLLAPEGKDHLKQALRQAMSVNVPELKVADLFFTEFLVQQ